MNERLVAKTNQRQYVFMFHITYVWSLPFIKSSICLTMLRIITQKAYRTILWLVMGQPLRRFPIS